MITHHWHVERRRCKGIPRAHIGHRVHVFVWSGQCRSLFTLRFAWLLLSFNAL